MYITRLNAHDVILGRGAGVLNNEGNLRFLALIQEHKPSYMSADRHHQKDAIAREIFGKIENSNGRFLRKVEMDERTRVGLSQSQDSYKLVEDTVAIEKVKQALRDFGHKRRERASARRINNGRKNRIASAVALSPPTLSASSSTRLSPCRNPISAQNPSNLTPTMRDAVVGSGTPLNPDHHHAGLSLQGLLKGQNDNHLNTSSLLRTTLNHQDSQRQRALLALMGETTTTSASTAGARPPPLNNRNAGATFRNALHQVSNNISSSLSPSSNNNNLLGSNNNSNDEDALAMLLSQRRRQLELDRAQLLQEHLARSIRTTAPTSGAAFEMWQQRLLGSGGGLGNIGGTTSDSTLMERSIAARLTPSSSNYSSGLGNGTGVSSVSNLAAQIAMAKHQLSMSSSSSSGPNLIGTIDRTQGLGEASLLKRRQQQQQSSLERDSASLSVTAHVTSKLVKENTGSECSPSNRDFKASGTAQV